MSHANAKIPSEMAVISCLAAESASPSIKFEIFPTTRIYSQDNYKNGFDATYFIISKGRRIGYAERGEREAILYGNQIFPVAQARMLPGFDLRPTELNPHIADWSTVTDANGNYLCVSFPFGDLGQSGSFQKNRSAYLMDLGSGKDRRSLYAATGNIDLLRKQLLLKPDR
jgi:hypothetical protein